MKRKVGLVLAMALAITVLLKLFIVQDLPEKDTNIENAKKENLIQKHKYPGKFKTVKIKGVDYKQARGEAGSFGGTLYSSTIGEGPKTFNPWTSKDATSSTIGELMFDGLVTTDAYTGQVVPQLAKSIDIDKSGKIYTVNLRHGLIWSDGKPITADDVVFTWNDIVAAGFGNTSMRDNVLINGQVPKAEKINTYTVRFTTPEPFAPFERQLSLNIAPKHVLQPVVKQGKHAFDFFWGVTTPPKEFITSGMFKLSSYVPAQRVELKKNPDYYAIDKENRLLPYLDKYIIYIVGDLNNELLKFEAGEIDLLSVKGSNVAKFKEMEKNSNYKVHNLGPDTGTMFMSFNLNRRKNDNGKYYVNPVKQKWFNDVNFRRAADYAIDRDSIVANILSGVGAPLYTSESLTSIFLDPKLKKGHPRNIKYAKELLKKSGFYWDKHNHLFDKDDNRVEFNLYTNAGNTERESTGVMVKQDLNELGIKVNFKPIEFNVLVGKLVGSLDWDATIISLTGSPLEPHNGRNVWGSSGGLHLFNQRTGNDLETKADLRDWEKELDNIFEEGAKEVNFKKRRQIYNRYQEIVYNQAPLLYLYSPLRVHAIRNKLGNVNPTPLGGSLHNVEEIYIKGDKR